MTAPLDDLRQDALAYQHATAALERARTKLRASVRAAAAAGVATKQIQDTTGWSRAQIKAVKAV